MPRIVLPALLALLALLVAPPAAAAGPGWRPPLPGPVEVVRGYDPPARAWLPGHRGVDLAGSPGERVRAADAGVVAFAGRVGGIGVVAVRHRAGLETTYEPVRPSVTRGERILAGATIGRLETAGSHCPPRACLHWGLRRGPDYLDPLALLGLGRVRLLPVPAPAPDAGPASLGAGSAVLGTGALVLHRRRRRRRRCRQQLVQVR